MTKWQATFLGLKHLPRELSGFEIEAFFTFTLAERQLIEERRRPALKLGLALQIGFLRMSGRLLDAVPMVPASLWRHLRAATLSARALFYEYLSNKEYLFATCGHEFRFARTDPKGLKMLIGADCVGKNRATPQLREINIFFEAGSKVANARQGLR